MEHMEAMEGEIESSGDWRGCLRVRSWVRVRVRSWVGSGVRS
jgi:hypothetical protein